MLRQFLTTSTNQHTAGINTITVVAESIGRMTNEMPRLLCSRGISLQRSADYITNAWRNMPTAA